MFSQRTPREPLTRKQKLRREVLRILVISAAALLSAFNLNSFVDTADLFPGGFSGAALLIIRLTDKYLGLKLAYSAVFLPLNIFPIYLGLRYLGKTFTCYSMYFTILSSVLTDAIPAIPITYDVLLICIFGGLINGMTIVLCLWMDASGGGTDFISIVLLERKGINAWNYILAGNVVILSLAGIFFGWDKALYSIIFQFVTTQVTQNLFKRYNQLTLIVITDMPESVYDKISILTHHDATLFRGEGFFRETTKHMIYSVIGADQAPMLIREIHEVDPHAFINVLKTERLAGHFYSRPRE